MAHYESLYLTKETVNCSAEELYLEKKIRDTFYDLFLQTMLHFLLVQVLVYTFSQCVYTKEKNMQAV